MSQRNPDDYEVGYKKPPKASQFKKGHSGFKGKRKKYIPVENIIIEELAKPLTITENGKRLRATRMEVIIKRTIAGILANGDIKAFTKLLKLVPPEAIQAVQFSEEGQKVLNQMLADHAEALHGAESYRAIKRRVKIDPHDFIDMLQAEWGAKMEEFHKLVEERYEKYLASSASQNRPTAKERYCGYPYIVTGLPSDYE